MRYIDSRDQFLNVIKHVHGGIDGRIELIKAAGLLFADPYLKDLDYVQPLHTPHMLLPSTIIAACARSGHRKRGRTAARTAA